MLQVLFIFFFFISVRLAFAIYFYIRLALYDQSSQQTFTKHGNHKLSVIVCYHNESNNVEQSLKSLNSQRYEDIEVILVDDQSVDDTLVKLRSFESDKIKIITHNVSHAGKKLALAHGIEQSKHDWLLMTDADCIMGQKWINAMMRHRAGKTIVLGYAPLQKSSTWVGKFARYETYFTALQYLSFALAGRPYMGVGRNLMYHRKIFDSAGGFSSHIDVASGDDDLLVNYAANTDNTAICIDPDSFVYSPAKETFSSFIRQKTRHVSSSHRYRWSDKILLGLSSVAHMMMYILAALLLFSSHSWWLMSIPIYWLMMILIQYPICRKLHSMDLWLLYPIYDIAMAIYYIIMIPFTFIKKQNTWS